MADNWTNKPKRSPFAKLLCEDGSFLLLETGEEIVLDQDTVEVTNKPKN